MIEFTKEHEEESAFVEHLCAHMNPLLKLFLEEKNLLNSYCLICFDTFFCPKDDPADSERATLVSHLDSLLQKREKSSRLILTECPYFTFVWETPFHVLEWRIKREDVWDDPDAIALEFSSWYTNNWEAL